MGDGGGGTQNGKNGYFVGLGRVDFECIIIAIPIQIFKA